MLLVVDCSCQVVVVIALPSTLSSLWSVRFLQPLVNSCVYTNSMANVKAYEILQVGVDSVWTLVDVRICGGMLMLQTKDISNSAEYYRQPYYAIGQ